MKMNQPLRVNTLFPVFQISRGLDEVVHQLTVFVPNSEPLYILKRDAQYADSSH